RYFGFEPSVAADREGRVLIAAQELKPRAKPFIIVWRSDDRGATWSERRPLGGGFGLDVWLQADPRGSFLAAYLHESEVLPGFFGPFGAVVQRSQDGGKTWKEPQVLAGQADKTVLAVSPSGTRMAVAFSPGKPQAAVLRSDDRGEHWQAMPH